LSRDVDIKLDNVCKGYQMYQNSHDRLKQFLVPRSSYYHEFWAARDVSFHVPKGKTIGIIGRNGSGKSTILQIIAGTLTPTTGKVSTEGRIAALLELGSGFNPEFTGRENVVLSGAIMGLSRNEIKNRMGQIENFAEIGEFIDRPVKTYSSGMFVRLSFASAVNVEPDILIVDEALAVGDIKFQLKCINKMKEFKAIGKTILFVSHDTNAIRNFCDDVIWMMDGHIHMSGQATKVIEAYEDFMKTDDTNEQSKPLLEARKNIDEGILAINRVSFLDANGKSKRIFSHGENMSVVVDYSLKTDMDGLVGGVALFDKQGTYICGLNTKLDQHVLPNKKGRYQLSLTYKDSLLLSGTYYIDVGFFESSAIVTLDYRAKISSFFVTGNDYVAEGIALLPHVWEITRS